MPNNEVATKNVDTLVRGYIANYRGTFERLLPSHVDTDTFCGLAAAAMYRNQDLATAAMRYPESLLIALRDCARLGHQPGTDKYALAVRKGRVQGIEQYQGVIQRMFNAGAVQSVHCEVVARGERFDRRDPFPPHHDADWFADERTLVDNLVGVYAYAILTDGGTSQIVVMGRAEVLRHRAAADFHGIWDGPFGVSMWKKTACHELEKWVPVSAEYLRVRAAAELAADAVSPPAAPHPLPVPPAGGSGRHSGSDIVDAEEVSDPDGEEVD